MHLHPYRLNKNSFIHIDTKNDLLALLSLLSLTLLGVRWGKFDPTIISNRLYHVTHLMSDDKRKKGKIIHIGLEWLKTPEAAQGRKINIKLSGFESADSIWFVPSSSGTTGNPKFMPISAGIFYDRALSMSEYFTDKPIVMFDAFPKTSNIASLNLFTVFATGGTYVLNRNYNDLVKYNVEHVVGSPQQLMMLIKNIETPDTPKLYQARVAGSALSPSLLKKLLFYFQTVRVSYGSTEAGPTTSKELAAYTEDRCVGLPYKGVVVEVIDEQKRPVAPTVEGIIRIKTPNAIKEYLNAPETTAESFSGEWFYPGDRGYLAEDGSLYITGRIKDQLNINGAKINAHLIDEQIQATEGVLDGFCFTEEEEGIKTLSVLVKAKKGVNVEKMANELAKRILKPYARVVMIPKRLYFVPNVPRNEGGKVLRHKALEAIAGIKPVTINVDTTPKKSGAQK